MKLVKCLIPNSVYNIQVYCKMGEKIDEKRSVLLGFKDCLPVITNSELNCKHANIDKNKKIVKVQVDPMTGEKFINLNGKKLKMVPESQVKTHLNSTNEKSLCIKATRSFRVLTKIPFTSVKADHKLQTNMNLMKLKSHDNLCHYSLLKKPNLISQKDISCDKDSRYIFGNNLIKQITTDNKKKGIELIDDVSAVHEKCSTQIIPKIIDMKNSKNGSTVHMLQSDNTGLQIKSKLKNVETQTVESYLKFTDISLDELIKDLDIDDSNLFDSTSFSLNPNWTNLPEQRTSCNLAEKFFEALRKALVPDHDGNM